MSVLPHPLLGPKTSVIADPFETPHSNSSAKPADSVVKLHPESDHFPRSLLRTAIPHQDDGTSLLTGRPACTLVPYSLCSTQQPVRSGHFSAQKRPVASQIAQNSISILTVAQKALHSLAPATPLSLTLLSRGVPCCFSDTPHTLLPPDLRTYCPFRLKRNSPR